MNKIITVITLLFVAIPIIANDNEDFKPNGKAIFTIFTNFHQGIGDNKKYYDDSGFELNRAVIGYQYNFTRNISSKILIDIDDPKSGSLDQVTYIRNAYVSYKNDFISAYFGVLGLQQFKTQENNWGHRYIYKSAMDEYKFNNSVDLGIHVNYKIADFISIDATISNGEGAKKRQDTEGKYRMGYGTKIVPIKGLTFRAYYDLFFAPEPVSGATNGNQTMLALFLGYETKRFQLGVEYDMLNNYKFVTEDDRNIFSAYGSVAFAKRFEAFTRYDKLMAEHKEESEDVYIAGVEWNVIKGIKIAPNFRYLNYTDSSQADGGYFYLNLEYKF